MSAPQPWRRSVHCCATGGPAGCARPCRKSTPSRGRSIYKTSPRRFAHAAGEGSLDRAPAPGHGDSAHPAKKFAGLPSQAGTIPTERTAGQSLDLASCSSSPWIRLDPSGAPAGVDTLPLPLPGPVRRRALPPNPRRGLVPFLPHPHPQVARAQRLRYHPARGGVTGNPASGRSGIARIGVEPTESTPGS